MHIDSTITPSPCHPQPGDVYDYDRQVPDVPEMTRLVVTGITPKTDWSDEHVGFELNGQHTANSVRNALQRLVEGKNVRRRDDGRISQFKRAVEGDSENDSFA